MNRPGIPEWDLLEDQKHARMLLAAFLENGRIPHALLFSGIEGSGKTAAASAFAMACNCTAASIREDSDRGPALFGTVPCGVCPPCRKVLSGNHPDVLFVEPSPTAIRIEHVRRLGERLSLKPYEAGRRFVIIRNAHQMTAEAGNALLKLLEEPPPQTFLILTTVDRADLLPTLVSRCQSVRFHPLPEPCITAFLSSHRGLSESTAGILAQMAHGSISRALALADSAQGEALWRRRRLQVLSAAGLDRPESLDAAPLALSLVLAQRLSADKAYLAETLDILQAYLRDLAVIRWAPPLLYNKDLTPELQYGSQHMSLPALQMQIKTVWRTQRDLESNVNPRLAMETLMMDIRSACYEKNRGCPV